MKTGIFVFAVLALSVQSSVIAEEVAPGPAEFKVGNDQDNPSTAPPDKEPPLAVREEYYRLKAEASAIKSKKVWTSEDAPRLSELERRVWGMKDQMEKEGVEYNRWTVAIRQKELSLKPRVDLTLAKALHFDVLTYPRIDGSTSVHPLSVVLACLILGAEYEWTDGYEQYRRMRLDNHEPFDMEIEFFLAENRLLAKVKPMENARLGNIINKLIALNTGTNEAYTSLIDGNARLILVAREPSQDELKNAKDKAVSFRTEPIALDAFVFIVNRLNPVRSLTTDQLKAIYSGKVEDWGSVGGRNGKITAYQREPNSGSQELMLNLFMGNTSISETGQRKQLVVMGMGGPFHALTENDNGIGYSVYYYEHFMAGSYYTRTIAVDGVESTYETIKSGKYPYVSKVYAVIRSDEPEDSRACRLWKWLITDEGQAVVEESGYVPLRGVGR